MAVAQSEEDKGEAAGRSTAAARLAARRAAKAAAKASKRGTAPIMPSRVTSSVLAMREAFEANRRSLGLGVLGAIAAVVAWYFISEQLGKHDHDSAELLTTAVTTANAPIVAPGEESANQNVEESYPTSKARSEKARDEFSVVIKGFADTRAGVWASLGQASAASELGHPDQAEKLYQQALASKDLDPFANMLALEGLGFALEAQQKYAPAAERFEKISGLEHGTYKAVGDFHRARMMIALGQKAKAGELLQTLVKAERAKPPGEGMHFDNLVSDAETILSELAVELDAPKLRVDTPSNADAMPNMRPGPSATAGGNSTGLTQEIVDALRKQLANGKGDKGLSKDLVDQLDKQVKSGATSGTTVKIPAPKPQQGKSQ